MTPSVHWLGAGLSSGPGIRRVATSGRPLVLWNRTLEKAQAALAGVSTGSQIKVKPFTLGDFQAALKSGDIVVSMLPATMHPEIAELCLAKRAHLVTTSYISDAMKAYHRAACEQSLSFVNESGLDPGLDHLAAHLLVQEYRNSSRFSEHNRLSFVSYCGGFPKHADDFRYKFSWSPAGVLRALKNTARHINQGLVVENPRPWEALTQFSALGEEFEVYPNRDSIPYLAEYGFESNWNIEQFVRGTLRLSGWAKAWSSIFQMLPSASNEDIERLSEDLWKKYAYRDDEQDRVVLYVGLEARENDKIQWSRYYALDESGTRSDTAMARLVSLPATFALELIEQGRAPKGVSGAPHEKNEILRWFAELQKYGIEFKSEMQLA